MLSVKDGKNTRALFFEPGGRILGFGCIRTLVHLNHWSEMHDNYYRQMLNKIFMYKSTTQRRCYQH